MIKESIISIFVVVLIFTTNYFLQNYTKNSVESMSSKLEELKDDLLNDNEEKINEKIEKILNNWNEIQHKMAFFIEHDELEKVETDLMSLKGYIEAKDYSTGVNELNKSIFVLHHISDKYDFNLINIF